MLQETASGRYPVESVNIMQDIDPDGRKLNEMAEDPEGILQLWRNSRYSEPCSA